MQTSNQSERGRRVRATVTVFVIGLLLSPSIALAAPAQTQAAPTDVRQLELNKPIERELKGDEAHTYEITLSINHYLNVVVEQKGIDVVVQVIAPDGKPIAEANISYGAKGLEPIYMIAETTGRYQLKVACLASKAPQGRYAIRLVDLRVATENDRATVEKERLLQDAAKSLREAGNLSRAGKYDEAILLAERALSIREKLLGIEDPLTVQSLDTLAGIYRDKGDYVKAESLYLRSLAINEKVQGMDHLSTANSLDNLASLYEAKDDYAKAEPLRVRALAIDEKIYGAEHPSTAISLNNLGSLYNVKGDYGKAEPLLVRALAIREKALGKEHPATANSLDRMGILYEAKGDYAKAELLRVRALAIYEKTYGTEHPSTAVSLLNLGALYCRESDYAKAEPLLTRALTVSEKVYGAEHPLTAAIINNLGSLYRVKGDYGKAEPLLVRALAVSEKIYGTEHSNTAGSLGNLASLYEARGDYAKAEPLGVRALAICEKALGKEDTRTAKMLNYLALLYQAMGKFPQAVSLRSRCNDVIDKDYIRNLASGSERQRLLYLNITADYLDFTITLHTQFATDNLTSRQMALKGILQRKGRALDATTDAIAALRRRASPDDQKLLDQLTAARSQLSNTTLKGAGKDSLANHQAKLKSLEEQVEKLEAELSRRSAEFRAQALPVTLETVRAVVPDDAALIEFVSFRPYDAKTRKYSERRYVAYLLTDSGDIKWADLGEAATIDNAVKAFRAVLQKRAHQRLSNLTSELLPKARALDNLIMRPVRPLLGDKKRLLLSPDGSLNLIPFEALVDEQNHYLVETYSISYLTSGRDLLRLQAAKPNKKTALVIADPDFDLSLAPDKAAAASDTRILQRVDTAENDKERIAQRVSARPGPKLGAVQLQPFERLPGSAKEGKKLKKLLPDATFLTVAQATETALKGAASPSILHISTHGGFLTDEPKPEANEQRGLLIRAGADDFETMLPANANIADPLLRSGLFFAGANTGRSGNDDGVLTALEATALDLYGTKLVVLSACDTGVGEVKNGDGVYGLRRALVLAGSETQVMSLWSVSDEGTRELMVAYYKRLLKGEGRGEALRQVRLKMLESKKRQHPYYWASFIQSGEWANLDGKRVD